MRLTRYTDFSLRVLIHLALNGERLCSIGEISSAYAISHNHLMKVVNGLVNGGFIETVRGRGGGMRLARAPEDITVGQVVRYTEEGLELADCPGCVLAPACGLTGVLAKGVAAMLAVFDSYTITNLVTDRALMRRMTGKEQPLSIDLI